MCRWGCGTVSTTYMCKWCGTRFCKECLRGDFGTGMMLEPGRCKQCNHARCQGQRVEYVVPTKKPDDDKGGRSRSASPSKSGRTSRAKSAKSAKSDRKSGKKSGKKSAGKKKKKKK